MSTDHSDSIRKIIADTLGVSLSGSTTAELQPVETCSDAIDAVVEAALAEVGAEKRKLEDLLDTIQSEIREFEHRKFGLDGLEAAGELLKSIKAHVDRS